MPEDVLTGLGIGFRQLCCVCGSCVYTRSLLMKQDTEIPNRECAGGSCAFPAAPKLWNVICISDRSTRGWVGMTYWCPSQTSTYTESIAGLQLVWLHGGEFRGVVYARVNARLPTSEIRYLARFWCFISARRGCVTHIHG